MKKSTEMWNLWSMAQVKTKAETLHLPVCVNKSLMWATLALKALVGLISKRLTLLKVRKLSLVPCLTKIGVTASISSWNYIWLTLEILFTMKLFHSQILQNFNTNLKRLKLRIYSIWVEFKTLKSSWRMWPSVATVSKTDVIGNINSNWGIKSLFKTT